MHNSPNVIWKFYKCLECAVKTVKKYRADINILNGIL